MARSMVAFPPSRRSFLFLSLHIYNFWALNSTVNFLEPLPPPRIADIVEEQASQHVFDSIRLKTVCNHARAENGDEQSTPSIEVVRTTTNRKSKSERLMKISRFLQRAVTLIIRPTLDGLPFCALQFFTPVFCHSLSFDRIRMFRSEFIV